MVIRSICRVNIISTILPPTHSLHLSSIALCWPPPLWEKWAVIFFLFQVSANYDESHTMKSQKLILRPLYNRYQIYTYRLNSLHSSPLVTTCRWKIDWIPPSTKENDRSSATVNNVYVKYAERIDRTATLSQISLRSNQRTTKSQNSIVSNLY